MPREIRAPERVKGFHDRTTGELVRCKECRYAYEHHDARGRWLLCNLQLYFEVKPDGFCAWGEKREDGNDTD